jgi:hypothetical protein
LKQSFNFLSSLHQNDEIQQIDENLLVFEIEAAFLAMPN